MDVVRNGYSRPACFFRDDTRQATIQWYHAPPGAKCFPTPHKWGSIFWYKFPWEADGVGEVYGSPYKYSQGETPPTVDGQQFCGRLEDFQNGCKFDPDINVVRDVFGVAECCAKPDPGYVYLKEPLTGFWVTEDGSFVSLE